MRSALLGDIAASVDYGVTASAEWNPVGPRFLRITDIQDDQVNWDEVPWCNCGGREAAASALAEGDIVFARTGATTGKSFLIRSCPSEAVFASYLIRVRLGAQADPGYVAHYFRSTDYWHQISSSARGAAQPGVNATVLRSLAIPLPPIEEQRRISAILDKADDLRAKRRAALAHLDSLTQSIFIDMFGEPVGNPRRWPVSSLGELGTVTTGRTPPTARSDLFGGRIPFVTPGDLESRKGAARTLTAKGAEQAVTVGPGAALVCCIGATIGKVGMTSQRCAFNQQINAVEWGAEVDVRFGYESLRFFRKAFASWGTSTTLPIINKSSFMRVELPVPPIEAQRSLATQLRSVDAQRDLYVDASRAGDSLFASVQHRAFSGTL